MQSYPSLYSGVKCSEYINQSTKKSETVLTQCGIDPRKEASSEKEHNRTQGVDGVMVCTCKAASGRIGSP